ncbi:hypothetical protein EDB80DRAFT_874474 [Ilyonectria destructans]|nr:hypothetical protein EDB80DRAFT_874474 [Ilyonectria destructans]
MSFSWEASTIQRKLKRMIEPILPAGRNNYLGRAYMWYNGTTPVPFGHGLHYTIFSVVLSEQAELRGGSYNTEAVVAKVDTDSVTGSLTWQTILQQPFTTLEIQPGDTAFAEPEITLERLVRVDENGNRVLYPRDYKFLVDLDAKSSLSYTLKGAPVLIEEFPQPEN